MQKFIIVVILVNAAVLGLLTSAPMRESTGPWLPMIDTVCLVIFVIELVIKLYAFRGTFFRSAWNIFDFVVIAVALVPGSGFAVLRALRVLRVLRLVSMLPALRRVVEALVRAVPGILSIGALLLVLFYVAAVMSTMLFGNSFDEYFGTIGRSLASLFQTMTMDNWSDIAREVTGVYGWAWAFFVPFILLSAFTVLNLFIAVMVDAMRLLSPGASAGAKVAQANDTADNDRSGAEHDRDEAEGRDQPAKAAPDGSANDGSRSGSGTAATPVEADTELLAEIRALRSELAASRTERNQN